MRDAHRAGVCEDFKRRVAFRRAHTARAFLRRRGAGANSATLNDNDMATGLRHGREDGREERAGVEEDEEEEEAAERRRRRDRGMRK